MFSFCSHGSQPPPARLGSWAGMYGVEDLGREVIEIGHGALLLDSDGQCSHFVLTAVNPPRRGLEAGLACMALKTSVVRLSRSATVLSYLTPTGNVLILFSRQSTPPGEAWKLGWHVWR